MGVESFMLLVLWIVGLIMWFRVMRMDLRIVIVVSMMSLVLLLNVVLV